MSTCLPQSIPILGQIDIHFRFRPECLCPGTADLAFQANIPPVCLRVNSPSTNSTLNLGGNKSASTVAFPNEPESVIVSRNSHFFSLVGELLVRESNLLWSCPRLENSEFQSKVSRLSITRHERWFCR